eukprot:scaffold55_cov237-Pinguiococcus_pyrenoidosus.AAC.4
MTPLDIVFGTRKPGSPKARKPESPKARKPGTAVRVRSVAQCEYAAPSECPFGDIAWLPEFAI